MAPHLRTTGVMVRLEMRYQNRHERVDGTIVAVCDIYVQVAPAWMSSSFNDYFSLGSRDHAQYLYRYRQGVVFSFVEGGSFAFFDYNQLLTSIVNAFVLMTIPGGILWFLAV